MTDKEKKSKNVLDIFGDFCHAVSWWIGLFFILSLIEELFTK